MAMFLPLTIFLISLSSFSSSPSHAKDTLTPADMLTDNKTLVSAGGIFELGFFNETISGYHYLGIWFKADATKVVWVGNRDVAILDSSGVLQIRSGNLLLSDRRLVQVIVNAANVASSPNTTATLLDTGNFVLKEADTGTVIWQSFDVPSDTYLPGMELGLFELNKTQPSYNILVSWASPQNPARGLFTLTMDRINFTKLTVWRGDGRQMDIAFWDGQHLRFIFDNTTENNDYTFRYQTIDEEAAYYTFSNNKKYDLIWFVMSSTGNLDQFFLANGNIWSVSHSLCEDSSGGNTGKCLATLPSMCDRGDDFSVMNGSLPSAFNNGSIYMGTSDCETLCKSNCSCTAFVAAQDGQPVCQLYYQSKKDILKVVDEKGSGIIYIRGSTSSSDGKNLKFWLAIALPLAFLLILMPISLCCYLHYGKRLQGDEASRQQEIINSDQVRLFQIGSTDVSPIQYNGAKIVNIMELGRQKDQELPLFSFSSIQTATNDFAKANKLGEGGYGPVYKGLLMDGREIAVKRLSEISRQGLEEFKNEVLVICKLQHRNLVRLLGCCIEGEESILIYEYMPNKSLDSFIFDSTKRKLLDWRKRMNIIEGIAQGILYLHKYSRLRIIHRDLKTSNILLDSGMNPKISDFGMARIFADSDTKGKTSRVVGTFGYMSPEYAMGGLFSKKSDVFSFGVILLEIISGKKNIAFFEADDPLNLLGNAWSLWKEGKSNELMDSTLSGSCSSNEGTRCIQVGLLCVQERAMDRPNMSDVVLMLSNETFALPLPKKEPASWSQLSSTDVDSSSSRQRHQSTIDVTTSTIHAS
ncbi:G-type lectin S-receptor-like serine/threonine-protein kinase B120 [Pyrus x bretschneideri]|uniref:G-type lectin S-receptor-like serine/threonine-protein kinase B120 n=1 Tax=Pyrus x bretschneideri TaxID=225117 RepID=UPI00202F44C5|nr:G-type lectin S-receptor-like serine/threonine-protein kinase B120 [Pyrus x bretschneideri]